MKRILLLPIGLGIVILVLIMIFLLVPGKSEDITNTKSQSTESADKVPRSK